MIKTVWQIDEGIDVPRLDHALPGLTHSGGSMEFPLYTDVILVQDVSEEGLRAGDVGVVVERHNVAGREPGYSVEFFDMLGNTVAVATVPASALRAPTPADRPTIRSALVNA